MKNQNNFVCRWDSDARILPGFSPKDERISTEASIFTRRYIKVQFNEKFTFISVKNSRFLIILFSQDISLLKFPCFARRNGGGAIFTTYPYPSFSCLGGREDFLSKTKQKTNNHHQYWLFFCSLVLKSLKIFRIDDVWVASFPKSGTTWTQVSPYYVISLKVPSRAHKPNHLF